VLFVPCFCASVRFMAGRFSVWLPPSPARGGWTGWDELDSAPDLFRHCARHGFRIGAALVRNDESEGD
jgi:hypothetical protein